MKKIIVGATISTIFIINKLISNPKGNGKGKKKGKGKGKKTNIKYSSSDIYKNNINNIVTIINTQTIESFMISESIEGLGTGFLYKDPSTNKIYIITNHHVIADSTYINVLIDYKLYKVKVIGSSSEIDLAVLKFIDEPPINSSVIIEEQNDNIEGEVAIAIGSPLGLAGTITKGIISSVSRDVSGDGLLYIQTDTAINPGNSGGPLFNDMGKVIGINTFILEDTIGLGFALPSSVALNALKSILKYGIIKKNYLGVVVNDIIDDYSIKGVTVDNVLKFGPSDNKLKKNDIILKFNNIDIPELSILRNILVYKSESGKVYDVEVERDSKIITIQIMLEVKNDVIEDLDDIVVQPTNYETISTEINKLSPYKTNLIKEALTIIDNKKNTNLVDNDIILEINNKPFKSINKTLDDRKGVESFKGLLQNARSNSNTVTLTIYRNKNIKNINYTLPINTKTINQTII